MKRGVGGGRPKLPKVRKSKNALFSPFLKFNLLYEHVRIRANNVTLTKSSIVNINSTAK